MLTVEQRKGLPAPRRAREEGRVLQRKPASEEARVLQRRAREESVCHCVSVLCGPRFAKEIRVDSLSRGSPPARRAHVHFADGPLKTAKVAAGNTVIPMASRSKGMLRNLLSKTKGEGVSAEAVEAWRKALPKNNRTMGRAKRGLYGGRHIQFGNNISEDGGNKTRRTWKPNVQEKRLFSLILDRFIRIKVTTHTLRCIDKAGCIDDYLLQMPLRKVENELALFWKLKIQQQYEKLSKMEVGFFPPEEEKKLEEAFERVKIARKASRAENREKDNPNAITEISNGTEGGIQDAMLDRKEGTESGVADERKSLSEFQGQPT